MEKLTPFNANDDLLTHKIRCIKHVRAMLSIPLKDAKDLVDDWVNKYNIDVAINRVNVMVEAYNDGNIHAAWDIASGIRFTYMTRKEASAMNFKTQDSAFTMERMQYLERRNQELFNDWSRAQSSAHDARNALTASESDLAQERDAHAATRARLDKVLSLLTPETLAEIVKRI